MPYKVLAIDDDAEILRLIKFALEKAGYSVFTCDNGRRAWDEILRVKPDLLILDVMLPGLDGYSLELKISQEANLREMPVIILTALEPSKTLFQKFPQMVSFMVKPFKIEDMLNTVQAALARTPRA